MGYERRCAVMDCVCEVNGRHQTCTISEHRALETRGVESHMAMFQLRHRLERLKIYHSPDEVVAVGNDASSSFVLGEMVEVESDAHPSKPDTGNIKIRAHFGRRRTHNEELCVATCDVILGQATMYGSEGPNGVCVRINFAIVFMNPYAICEQLFHKILFPTSTSLPGVIFHDNNCRVKALIDNIGDTHFNNCVLPVDVFHMKSKHKESDDDCNHKCNPALFPGLMVGDKWRFNSSAAEITNAWFGGFQSMVREMRVDRYNFFLDKMIKYQNRFIVRDLVKQHAQPYLIPRDELLRD